MNTVCLFCTLSKIGIYKFIIINLKLSAVLMLMGSVLSILLLVYFIHCSFKWGLGKVLKDKNLIQKKRTSTPIMITFFIEAIYILELTFTQLLLSR